MLTFYQTQVSRLLHDPNFQYWPQTELTDYINEARNRIAQDTKALRQVVTGIALTAQQEIYTPQSLLTSVSGQVVDIMGITIYWGTQRIKLGTGSFTQVDAQLRQWANFYSRPVAYAKVGANLVYLAPSPDQAYISDWDAAVIPNALTSDSTPEQLPVPFQESVQYYAAYKAKFKEQALGEANIFLKAFIQNLAWCSRAFNQRTIPNPYRINA
jgi:hypothetical protein